MNLARPVGESATLIAGAVLVTVTALAWLVLLRSQSAMIMPGTSASLREAVLFTLQWGVMMAAMMLPSAMPMILLYRTVSSRLASEQNRVVSVTSFVFVYLFVWLLLGVPVYGVSVATARAAAQWTAVGSTLPYVLAGVLVLAGVYQFTNAKRVCLRYCEMPLSFLMRRWRTGYAATLKIAFEHAAYCLGCCWALMVILVAAGAMSLPWVLAIALAVFAEKVLPRGWQTARVIGVVLILLGIAVAVRPQLAGTIRGTTASQMNHPM